MQRFGATPEAWDHFSDTLKLTADLLPVVSNPNAEISPNSKMKALGKTPSMYNRDRKAAGLSNWTDLQATEHDIGRWKSEADYGICIQTRAVRAFDIDVEDTEKADQIQLAIERALRFDLPCRFREDSGKRLLAFTYHRPLTKRVVPVEGGMVEILADGQQFVAAGMHPKGARYRWTTGEEGPRLFPVITGEQFEQVWSILCSLYATGEPRIARERRSGTADPDLIVHDDVADWLVANWETYDVGRDGQVFIECPFEAEHTSDSGPTATAYFPAGTGGYQRGHFVCLHAHCTGREDRDFLDGTGYAIAQFSDLTGGADHDPDTRGSGLGVVGAAGGADLAGSGDGAGGVHGLAGRSDTQLVAAPQAEATPWPPLIRDKKGKIESTAENLVAAIKHGGMIFRHIVYDAFTDDIMWAPFEQPVERAAWRKFGDADTIAVRIELERRGFKPMGKDLLRDAIHHAAHANRIDSAVEWLSRLRWDGVPRIDTFAIDCWGWAESAYARAVGRYVWTAMAGRVLQPGVRADMAPILVGEQGVRKTTAIQMMVPHEDAYAEIKLNEKDDDLSRKLRGKLIGELEELRGLNTRAIEEIKAFVSRRRESWVPKYKEFEAFFWRRCLLVGSTNEDEFLADPTGERRWLPGHCGFIDVELIQSTRDQLWAEGAAAFMLDGVAWEAAERLAEQEHPRYKISDSWERAIGDWLDAEAIGGARPLDKGYVTVHEVMGQALHIATSQQNRSHEMRVQKALKHLGFKPGENGEGKVYVR
jgi:predicted P-loop ATPase